jgi:hypothetical protein
MRIMIAIALAAAALARAAEPPEGRWDGTVQIPGNELHIVIDLAKNGNQWTGSAIVPGYGVKGAALTGITIQGSEVSFTLKGALGEPTFSGRLNPDGVLTGDFLQSGNTAAFRLLKTGPPQVDPPRQSTIISKDLEGEWQGDMLLYGNKVKATLKLANQAGGAATAQFIVVGKRENILPVELVRQEGDWLLVDVPQYRMTYEARWRKDGKELAGTFAQGPMETPLVLQRGAK